MSLNIPGLTDPTPGTIPTLDATFDPNVASGSSSARPAMPLDSIGLSQATNFVDFSWTLPKIAASPSDTLRASAATEPSVWQGWDDRHRGVNSSLGDTETAVHLFYQRHLNLRGNPPGDGTQESAELKTLHLWADAQRLARNPDPAQTHWSDDDRTIKVTMADKQIASQIFAQQHPDLHGREPAPASALGKELHTLQKNVAQNKYNATINAALAKHATVGVDAKVLKSLLIEESGFDPNVKTNAFGYSGIAQLGPSIASTRTAEDPLRAIPLAAKTLQEKAAYLDAHVFPKYGQPKGVERIKFIAGAYNGGEGTISTAVQYAAKEKRDAAIWSSLQQPTGDPSKSPLYRAAEFRGMDGAEKYKEIGTYATDVVQRARQ